MTTEFYVQPTPRSFVKMTASGGTEEDRKHAVKYVMTAQERLEKAARLLEAVYAFTPPELRKSVIEMRDEIAFLFGV